MKCQYCGPEETELCVSCEQFFCECYGCNCVQRGVFRKPKPDNPFEDPEIRQVCLKCGFRKASPHALACPFCFPQGMVYELAWMKDLELGAVSQPIPPIRENQPNFKPLSIMGQLEKPVAEVKTAVVHREQKNMVFVHPSVDGATQLSLLGSFA